MLGIRHCNGHAIDLFLGDITQFQNDGIVRLGVSGSTQELEQQLSGLLAAGRRHVAIAADSADLQVEEGVMMTQLYGFLTGVKAKMPHRLSFVVTSKERYNSLQDALFAAFPES